MADGYDKIGAYPTDETWNSTLVALEEQNLQQHGRGIVEGLICTNPSGLDVEIGVGKFVAHKLVEIETPETYTMTASTGKFLYRNASGTIVESDTLTDPGGSFVCLGFFDALVSSVTITEEGRVYVGRWTALDVFEIGDGDSRVVLGQGIQSDQNIRAEKSIAGEQLELPQRTGDPATIGSTIQIYSKAVGGVTETFVKDGAGNSRQITQGGVLRIESPVMVGAIRNSVNTETLTADKVGSANDANIQVLTPSGANRKYIAPAVDISISRTIINGATSGSNTIIVRDHADANTLATLNKGDSVCLSPQLNNTTYAPEYKTSYAGDIVAAGAPLPAP